MDSIKTAYSTAYNRLLLLAKKGKIGDVISVDATCTSLADRSGDDWNSITAWGPTALLPVFQLLGTDYKNKNINSLLLDSAENFDLFTKIDFTYQNAVASIKVGKGVKSEGELIISGTKDIFMFLLHGGKQTILKYVLKIKMKIRNISTS